MNTADKRAAEEAMNKLRDNALEMYYSKSKNSVKKNHERLEKIKKYLGENK